MTKNLFLPPDASPERRKAQADYVAASERLSKSNGFDGAFEAYRMAEREFGRVLLTEDMARRPHIYAKEQAPEVLQEAPSSAPTLAAENERLRTLNAQLMGDDEFAPRYTTRRLRHEVKERTQVLAAENERLKALVAEIEHAVKRGEYMPGDYPIVPAKVYDMLAEVRALIASAKGAI